MFENLWVEKYRPTNLDEIVLSREVRDFVEDIARKQETQHLLFCSPPGSGKTSLAKLIANDVLGTSHLYINASDERGIDTIRQKVTGFAQTRSFDGKLKIIILDECDGLTSDAQRALRNTMEEYADNARFILTANYRNRITTPLISRVVYFDLKPPLKESIAYCIDILTKEKIDFDGQEENLITLLKKCYPDIRRALNTLSRFVKDGKLKIEIIDDDFSFAKELFAKITNPKTSELEIREHVIANETEFGSDYQSLLKGLFEQVYDSNLSNEVKREAILIIGEGLYKHNFVMDFEINAYCTILKMRKVIIPQPQ